MRILILGSGVIGVTSAWYLRQQGHDVVVVDREAAPAMETSFANAGQVSPGYASPWPAPGIPAKAIGWLLSRHAPLAIKPTADPAQYRDELVATLDALVSLRWRLGDSEGSRDAARERRAW